MAPRSQEPSTGPAVISTRGEREVIASLWMPAHKWAAPTAWYQRTVGVQATVRIGRWSDLLPAGVSLTATDLNPPMLEIARTKFWPGEQVEFQPADATALPFADGSFDEVVCQFGVMFFPDKDRSYREV